MSLAPKTGPLANVNIGAIPKACGGARRWSRNGGDTTAAYNLRVALEALEGSKRFASYRVNTRFMAN